MSVQEREFAQVEQFWHEHQSDLPMFVVYRPTTADYPGQWFARVFLSLSSTFVTDVILLADTLDDLRKLLPRGLHCLGRDDEDDPVIEEVWI